MESQSFSHPAVEGLFYPGGNRQFLLEQIEHLARYSDSIVVVSGLSGMGKSVLANAMLANRSADTEIVLLDELLLCNEAQLFNAIIEKLGLPVVQGDNSAELRTKIADHCREQNESGRHSWLILDNAGDLDPSTLSAIFELLEECAHLRLLLMAQPQFVEVIEQHRPATLVLQVLQLEPLNREETEEYLSYCHSAIGFSSESRFSPQTLDYIHRKARGVPGNSNKFADEVRAGDLPDSNSGAILPRWHIIALVLLVVVIAASWLIPDREVPADSGQRIASPLASHELDQPKSEEGLQADRRLNGLETSMTDAENAALDMPVIELSGLLERGIAGDNPSGQNEIAPQEKTPAAQSLGGKQKDWLSNEKPNEKPNANEQIETQPLSKASAIVFEDPAGEESGMNSQTIEMPVIGEPNKKASLSIARQSETTQGIATQHAVAQDKADTETFYYRASGKSGGKIEEGEARILQWDSQAFLVQLLGTYSREGADQYLNRARPVELVYFQKSHNNRLWYTVVYGVFSTREEAIEALERLPSDLPVRQPWIRRAEAVQKEIRQARDLD